MTFGDFVESIIETPICCELKQHLDKLPDFYEKDPKKCMLYIKSLRKPLRESARNNLLLLYLLLSLEIYESNKDIILEMEPESLTDKKPSFWRRI